MSELAVPKTPFIDDRTGDIAITWRQFILHWVRAASALDASLVAPPVVDRSQEFQGMDVTPPVLPPAVPDGDVSPPVAAYAAPSDDVSPDVVEVLRAEVRALKDEIDALKQGTIA